MDFNIEKNLVQSIKEKLIKNLKLDGDFKHLDIGQLIEERVNKIVDSDLGDIDNEIHNQDQEVVSEEKKELKRVIKDNLEIEIEQENNKRGNAGERYEEYKIATNYEEYIRLGGYHADFIFDYRKGLIVLKM